MHRLQRLPCSCSSSRLLHPLRARAGTRRPAQPPQAQQPTASSALASCGPSRRQLLSALVLGGCGAGELGGGSSRGSRSIAQAAALSEKEKVWGDGGMACRLAAAAAPAVLERVAAERQHACMLAATPPRITNCSVNAHLPAGAAGPQVAREVSIPARGLPAVRAATAAAAAAACGVGNARVRARRGQRRQLAARPTHLLCLLHPRGVTLHTHTNMYHPQRRYDESDDSVFYDSPRFVYHIDDGAVKALTE